VKQPEFPLFEPRERDDERDVVTDVFSTIVHEVNRAAYVGRDTSEVERVRFSVDVPDWLDLHVRALAIALGTSRRALAAKLLNGAILEAINVLQREGSGPNAEVHFIAVLDTYNDAMKDLRESNA
jgi:hypothetical protein